ncbi:MAG TPA: serine/threonine-protein kinase [Hyphomonadaceae bacterium]|nr:serine/threonine-protein kinase [Hyphomonadaceae bacterium]
MICPQCQTQNADNAKFCGSCGTPLAAAQPSDAPRTGNFRGQETVDPSQASAPKPAQNELAPGGVFADRYAIESEIGSGLMGSVYRATDKLSDRPVALKLIRADRLAGKDAARRVIRESLKMRDIRHPNIVTIYDAGESQGVPFIAMELIEGPSLNVVNKKLLMKSNAWPFDQAVAIVRQIAGALGTAHAAGIVHRDLKPSSVEVVSQPDGGMPVVKVNDFGITSASGVMETGATSPATTPYRAPELLTAPDAAHASADFYSLSAIFYELLVNVVPAGHWQPPSQSRLESPVGIDLLIERGLSNNPRNRPQTAAEFLSALDEAVKAAPKPDVKPAPAPQPAQPQPVVADIKGPALPPSPKPRMSPAMRRIISIGVGAIGLAAVIGGIMEMTGGDKGGSHKEASNDDHGGPLNNGGGRVQPAPTPTPLPPSPPPPPPPKPAGINYAAMSGYWTDDFSNTIQVRVSRSGQVQGQVSSGPMLGYLLAGQFNGPNFQFQIGTQFGAVGGSVGMFDGGCHIRYATTDAYGNPVGSAQLHINHPPGAPCP